MSWQVVDGVSTNLSSDSVKFELEDLLQFENTEDGWLYKIERIDNEHFVVGYLANQTMYLRIFKYDGELTVLDTYSSDKYIMAINFTMCLLDASRLMVSYAFYEGSYKQTAYTFEINSDYEISIIDSLQHGARTSGGYDALITMDSTHCVLSTNDFSDKTSRVKSFSVDSSYNITLIDTYVNGDNGVSTGMTKVDDTHFMLANETTDERGVIRVFEIDGSYNISLTSTLTHDETATYYFALLKMPDDKYILVYTSGSSPTNDSLIKVFGMDNYVLTQESSVVNEKDNGYNYSIVQVDDSHFIVEYVIGPSGAATKAYELNTNNTVTLIDTLNVGGDYGYIIKLRPSIYAMAYLDADTYFESYINMIEFISDEDVWNKQTKPTTIWEVQ